MNAPDKWYPDKTAPRGTVVGRFEYFDLQDNAASREADELVHKQIVILRTKISGSTDDTAVKVKPGNQVEFQKRFPEAWQAFQGNMPEVEGTPLADLPEMTREKVQRLSLDGITVIEQLAGIGDNQCQAFGFGYRKLRDAAKTFLDQRTEEAVKALTKPKAKPKPKRPRAAPKKAAA